MTEAAVVPAAQPREAPKEVAKAAVPEEKIRLRAYEIYVERNFEPGHAEDDWFRAELEITGKPAAQTNH